MYSVTPLQNKWFIYHSICETWSRLIDILNTFYISYRYFPIVKCFFEYRMLWNYQTYKIIIKLIFHVMQGADWNTPTYRKWRREILYFLELFNHFFWLKIQYRSITVVSKEKNVVLCGTGFFSYILELQLEEPRAGSKICKGV